MDKLLQKKIAGLLDKLDSLLPEPVPAKLDSSYYRWTKSHLGIGHLVAVPHWRAGSLADLWGLDDEIAQLRRNTKAFVAGRTANHALLTGPRGCGKTSIVLGVVGEFAAKGLKVVRMNRDNLVDLPLLATALSDRPERFVVVCDELSFAEGGEGHLAVKSALDELDGGDGGLLVYATSNRRHLIPEDAAENLAAVHDESGELHPGETTEEKISLSDRFGLWIPVFAPQQDEYLAMVAKWFANRGRKKFDDKMKRLSLQWARERGSMNGRIASQFVKDCLASERK